VTRHTSGFLTRLIALIRKETRQMLRDRSNLMVGLLLPAALILLFGYGLSFDVRDAPVAVVLEDRSETARDAVAGLSGSPYLAPVAAPDMGRAVALLRAHTVDAIVRVPVDFTARKAAGEGRIQVLLNGYDATTAMTIGTYIDGAIQLSVRCTIRIARDRASTAAAHSALSSGSGSMPPASAPGIWCPACWCSSSP
jgi:ABC-2 type transport system permease protein